MTPSQAQISCPMVREVAAVVVVWRGHIGLFKRSCTVGSDVGRWHCITGFVEESEDAFHCGMRELYEETGLAVRDLLMVRTGPVLQLEDGNGDLWTVSTFLAESRRRRLCLNDEHDAYRWVTASRLSRFDGQVWWLKHVLAAVEPTGGTDIPGLLASDVLVGMP